jgi:hypothetical protein
VWRIGCRDTRRGETGAHANAMDKLEANPLGERGIRTLDTMLFV